jgi:hypothetical protein
MSEFNYRDHYNQLAEEWIYVNGAPFWQYNTISLSVHEVSKYKNITVISIYRKPDGSFLYPFKMHITSAKIKSNVRNGRVIKSNVNGCWCYLVPIEMFREGFAHVPGVDYDINLKSSDFIKEQ